jgi:hypothetical protein
VTAPSQFKNESYAPELQTHDIMTRRKLDALTLQWVRERHAIDKQTFVVRWPGELTFERWTTAGQADGWAVRKGVYATLDEAKR